MDSSESNHTPRSLTVSQLWTTDDPTGSDRYAAGILDSVELFSVYATDGQTDGRTKVTLIAPFPTGAEA